MLKLEFTNAVVKDDGYGLKVNGKELSEIISTALGTKVGDRRAGYKSDIPEFKSTCCNITVTIDPQPVTTLINVDTERYLSVEKLEEVKREQFKKKNAKTDPEE